MKDLPPIIGHRGAAAEAPENTLAGIRRARASGAVMVEFDVKLTKDGAPVLMHDERLGRTTDGRGLVREVLLDEIRRLDAGSWFDPSFAGEPVPSLQEAAALCLDLGLAMNIEIKPSPGRAVETTIRAIETLSKLWPASAAPPLISSFEEAALRAAKDALAAWPRGFLASRLPKDWRARVQALGCTTVHLGANRLTAANVHEVRTTDLPLLVYTVNDVLEARRLLKLGARGIITDRVRGLVDALQEDSQ